MDKFEKEVAAANLKSEEEILKQIKQVYAKALQDVQKNIASLDARVEMKNAQSTVFQRKYQKALESQIKDVLKTLETKSYKTINGYLKNAYNNGYIGHMYMLQNHTGCTCIMPINQQKVLDAFRNDSKISTEYYSEDPLRGRVAEDIDLLKKRIQSNVSRGIIAGKTWAETAYDIASGMKNSFGTAMNDAMRIARTEGHKINQTAYLHAGDEATKQGADIVKQWDSTLDNSTRPWHRDADGQIREWKSKFMVMGEELDAPGVGGSARNVINCRCQLLQRAKWALDDRELETLKQRAAYYGLDKSRDFEDFKSKYLKLPASAGKIKSEVIEKPTASKDEKYNILLAAIDKANIQYRAVQNHAVKQTFEQIVSALSGGDRTQGSCASVGLAYIGQKMGWNILDFRDGKSRRFFSSALNLKDLSQMNGIKTLTGKGASEITVGKSLLKQCEIGKEYYLCVGRHASIVRRLEDKKYQYLELQSATNSGWNDFDGNLGYTLNHRFGCRSRSSYSEQIDFMIDIDASEFGDDFKSLLGYINTAEDEQRKGSNGSIK